MLYVSEFKYVNCHFIMVHFYEFYNFFTEIEKLITKIKKFTTNNYK